MKNLPLLLILAFLQTPSLSFAGDEEAAVIATFNREFNAFLEKDYEAWTECWVHESYVSHCFVKDGYLEYIESWEKLAEHVKRNINIDHGNNFEMEKGDYTIRVEGDMAYVISREKVSLDLLEERVDIQQVSTNVLKKEDGVWKFVSMTIMNQSSFESTELNNEVRLHQMAYEFLLRGQVDESIEIFELITRLFPESFIAWYNLGDAYRSHGDDQAAREAYQNARALKPDDAETIRIFEGLLD